MTQGNGLGVTLGKPDARKGLVPKAETGTSLLGHSSLCQLLPGPLGLTGAQAEAADPAFKVVTVKSEHLQAGCSMQ